MKIATYNVNGVNGRLDVLLRWLEQASPELKSPDAKFPVKAIEAAGRRNLAWPEKLEWRGDPTNAR